MTDNIVERLREPHRGKTEREAADEIERLRALLKEHGIKRHTISNSDAAEDDDL